MSTTTDDPNEEQEDLKESEEVESSETEPDVVIATGY